MEKVAGFIVFLIVLLGFPKAFADKFNTETSSSTRALGMGDAAINTERGGYSVFYNPANIAAKDTKVNFNLLNFQIDMDQGSVSQLSNAQIPHFTNLSSLYPELVKNPDTFGGGRYSLYPNITLRNLSIGVLYEVNQGAAVSALNGQLRIKARDRFVPTAALAFRLFSGILRFGAMAQLLDEGNADTTVNPPIQSSSLDYKNFIRSGSGLSTTGGATLTLPFRYLPSFSVVARNIGGTNLTRTPLVRFGDLGGLPAEPMMFDFAVSTTYYLGRRAEMKFEADYRDLTNKLEGGRFRHVFLGTELSLFEIVKLRGGLMHGYPTAGFGLTTRKASLDLAVYSDELDDRLRGSQDTRYVLQYTYSFFK